MVDIICKTETAWDDNFIMAANEKECEVMVWVNLVLHMQKWRAVVDMATNILIS